MAVISSRQITFLDSFLQICAISMILVSNHTFLPMLNLNFALQNSVKAYFTKYETKRCTYDDVRVGVIGHGGLLRAFSFARPIRGSGHV